MFSAIHVLICLNNCIQSYQKSRLAQGNKWFHLIGTRKRKIEPPISLFNGQHVTMLCRCMFFFRIACQWLVT